MRIIFRGHYYIFLIEYSMSIWVFVVEPVAMLERKRERKKERKKERERERERERKINIYI